LNAPITLDQKAAILAELMGDFNAYAQDILRIRPKSGGAPVPLLMNEAQAHMHRMVERQLSERGRVRAIVLKGRQQGVSTYTEGRFYWKLTHRRGAKAYILTHEQPATDNLFGMVERFWQHAPPKIRPHLGKSNAKELVFDGLDSSYAVATAGSKDTGRSGTAQYLHGCLAAGTPVVDGITGRLRLIETMQPGDTVRTHTGKPAPITFRSTQTKGCIEVVMRGLRDFPLVCSREHKFWTERGWVEGGFLRVGDRIGYPVAELGDAPMTLPFAIPLAQRTQGGGAEHRAPNSVAADEALGLLIGLYLAEGCVSKQWKTGVPSCVVFTMHEAEVERNAIWVEALAPLFASLSIRPREGSKSVTIEAYGKALATRMLEWCGEKDQKRLPAWWRAAPREFVQGMVRGYLCGDGHFSATRDRRISATSIRSALTIGMRDAIASLGFGWAGVEYKSAGIRHGRDEKEAWMLRLCGDGVEGLSRLCDKPFVERQRADRLRAGAKIRSGYAWVPVVDISEAGERQVYEFEIGHDDHSYCILHGATHNSEVGFWANAADHLAGLGQVVPDAPQTEIVFESTANGTANVFHELWTMATRGRSEFMPIFIPWFWQREYTRAAPADFECSVEESEYREAYGPPGVGLTLGQMAWRQNKIDTDFRGDTSLFDQEYPASAELAFASSSPKSLIKAAAVSIARRSRNVEAVGPRIWGLDPAEYGDDDTALYERQGRVAKKLGSWNGLGTMETVGKVGVMIDKLPKEKRPDLIAVDSTGIGSGVADRLTEEGYPVVRVHFGGAARDTQRYVIARDEIWGEMKDWLDDHPASIDDDDNLAAQLTSVQYSYDSKRRIKLESKEAMKARGLRSPDDADALALTFSRAATAGSGDDFAAFRRKMGYAR
jgi:hypothetical protein